MRDFGWLLDGVEQEITREMKRFMAMTGSPDPEHVDRNLPINA